MKGFLDFLRWALLEGGPEVRSKFFYLLVGTPIALGFPFAAVLGPPWLVTAWVGALLALDFAMAFHDHWWGIPVGVALGAVYLAAGLTHPDSPAHLVLVLAVLLASSDRFRRWGKKKLGAARSSLTEVAQAAFRREAKEAA